MIHTTICIGLYDQFFCCTKTICLQKVVFWGMILWLTCPPPPLWWSLNISDVKNKKVIYVMFLWLSFSLLFKAQCTIQWKPLNVIRVNVIIRLMWSIKWSPFSIFTVYWPESLFSYCYHSVNVISFSLSQTDHIKRLPL